MRQTQLIMIAAGASALVGFGLGGALPSRTTLQAPPPAAPAVSPPTGDAAGAGPVAGTDSIGPLLAPIWSRGRISGFVAAEISVDLAPGATRTDLMPTLQDSLLTALYRAGAEGRLEPGATDPEALQHELLEAVRRSEGAGMVQALRIGRLLHQENRPR